MFGQAVKARLALTTLHCLKSVVQSNTKQWQLCVRPCFRELLSFVVLFATWLLKLESTDGVCTSIFVLNNSLWVIMDLWVFDVAENCTLPRIAPNSKERNTNKTRVKSIVWNLYQLCAGSSYDLLRSNRPVGMYVFLLSSVMSLPSRAELCHRLKLMWMSLNGPTCLRAWLQPFDIALQPPALWLFHCLLSSTLQRKLMAQRLLCFPTNARNLVRVQPANNLFGVRVGETDGGGGAARCLPLWQTSGDHSAVRADKRDDGEGAKANASGC